MSPWQLCLDSYKNPQSFTLYISIIVLASVLAIADIWQTHLFHNNTSIFNFNNSDQITFDLYLSKIMDAFFEYLSANALIGFTTIVLFCFVSCIIIREREGHHESSHSLLIKSVKIAITKGILSSIIVLFITFSLFAVSTSLFGSLAQVTLIICSAIFLPLCFLISQRNDNAWQLVKLCINMSYAPKERGQKASIFFQLCSFELFFLAATIIISSIRSYIYKLDLYLNIPRKLWWSASPIEPLSWTYLGSQILYSLLMSFCLVSLAVTVAHYIAQISSGDYTPQKDFP